MNAQGRCVAVAVAGISLVAGCGAAVPRGAVGTESAEPGEGGASASRSVPVEALPTSYEYVLTSTCGERNVLGAFRVVVRDDEVTDVVGVDENNTYEPRPDEVPTLADLLEMAGSAGADAEVDLVVDPDGVPVSLRIDHVPAGIDDEECYGVSALHVTAP